MPVSYKVGHSGKLMRTSCTGSVHLAQVLEHFETLRRDPLLPGEPDVLLSLVGLETPPGTPQLHAVSDHMEVVPLRFRHCAIVADRDLVFGIARMFQVIAGKHFREVRIFRAVAEAQLWLESSHR